MYTKTLIVIAGPTAIGKTDLAIKIAKEFKTEILSADSRQFYIEMNIGTAKPSIDDLNEVKHHFVNSHHITDIFNVGDFEKNGLKTIEHIFEKNNFTVLVGGSGLYINAICNGFDDFPNSPVEIRESLNLQFKNNGLEGLQNQLKTLDPEYYNTMDTNNPQRIIRALEVCLSTGFPYSTYRKQNKRTRPFNVIKIGLNIDREHLYHRINHRVDQMIENGLIEEVRQLITYRKLNALNTVGYSELFEFIDHTITKEEAVNKIKQNSRRFAKRQLTWFRKDQDIKWFEPDQYSEILKYISEYSSGCSKH